MSNIRSYLKEKEKRGYEQQDSFSDRIKKHRMGLFYRVLLGVLIVGSILLFVYLQQKNKVYTKMNTISTAGRQELSSVTDIGLAETLVTYSKDGIYCTDSQGNALWNQTYEMQNPMVATCQNVLAVADYNGRKVFVMNDEKKLGEVTTNMPIRSLCVAANGVVLTVQADTSVTWIYLYDSQGKELAYFHTRMNDTGYPTTVTLSDNAKLVGVGYTYLEAGTMQTRVAFYNFGDVGENQIDHLVSGYNYADTLVPYLHFMNESTAFAVADNRLMIYGGSEVPETKKEQLLDEEIQAVYNSDKYIGLVFFNNSSDSQYMLQVLNTQGEEITRIPLALQSISDARILFDDSNITIYNEQKCLVYSLSGKLRYEGTFEKGVRAMVPQKGTYRYLLAHADSAEVVELK